MKKISNFWSRALMFVFSMFASVAAFAQETGTSAIFSSMQNELTTAKTSIKPILNIVIGLVSAIYVVINLAKYFKGDRESSSELIKVAVGVVVAVILLAIINAAF